MSSSYQYLGPLIFLNSSYNRVQFRKPGSSSYGRYAYSNYSSWEDDNSYIWIFIWCISSNGYTKYTSCIRDKDNNFNKDEKTILDDEEHYKDDNLNYLININA